MSDGALYTEDVVAQVGVEKTAARTSFLPFAPMAAQRVHGAQGDAG